MNSMFFNATSFNSDISNWNTSNVINMGSMFEGASSFNQDISTNIINIDLDKQKICWDVSNVSNMNRMFYNASNFSRNIEGWCIKNIKFTKDFFTDFDKGSSLTFATSLNIQIKTNIKIKNLKM